MNLTLCYYAISDREKLKRCFCRMLQITSGAEDEDRYFPTMVSSLLTTLSFYTYIHMWHYIPALRVTMLYLFSTHLFHEDSQHASYDNYRLCNELVESLHHTSLSNTYYANSPIP